MKTEDFEIQHEGITIRGRMYLPAGARRWKSPAVILCHGIPRGIPDPKDRGYLPLLEGLVREGRIAVFFNFRGAGESTGNFDLKGWTRDLGEVVGHCFRDPRIDNKRIALWGFSGGAAASVCVAAREPLVAAVAACACPARFDFWGDEGAMTNLLEHFRAIGLVRDPDFPPSLPEWKKSFVEIAPEECVAGISPRPLLIVHGDADALVNVDHAYRLYRAAGDPRLIRIISGGEHNLRQDPRAVLEVMEWLERIGL
ncbi:MAG: alpha/beta hydrolase [bacterium]|nr:alpha/beta hydrolase [bacterium]